MTLILRSDDWTFCPYRQQFEWHRILKHTHTRLTALYPGLPRWAGTRKVEPVWILLKQVTVSGSGISWAICKSATRSRQITTPAPHHSIFFYRPDALPATQPTASKHWRHNIAYWHVIFIDIYSSELQKPQDLATNAIKLTFVHLQTSEKWKDSFGRGTFGLVMLVHAQTCSQSIFSGRFTRGLPWRFC